MEKRPGKKLKTRPAAALFSGTWVSFSARDYAAVKGPWNLPV